MESKINHNLAFNAKFINSTKIKRFDDVSKLYQNLPVTFAEIDVANKNDIKALGDLIKDWGYDSFADTIAHTAKYKQQNPSHKNLPLIYMLTFQNKNLSCPNSDNILGLIQISRLPSSAIFVEYLQSGPKSLYTVGNIPFFKYVGTRILDSLQNLYPNNDIVLKASKAKKFYEKLGFICIDKTQNKYCLPAGRQVNTSFIV